MSSDDVKMTLAAVFWRVARACDVYRRVEEKPETREARVRSDGGQNLRFCRSVDEDADRAVRVTKEDLRVRILMWRVGDIPN